MGKPNGMVFDWKHSPKKLNDLRPIYLEKIEHSFLAKDEIVSRGINSD